MMLVRMDPESSRRSTSCRCRATSRSRSPRAGRWSPRKLNAAYFVGGPNLLIKILQQQVFPGLKINHVVDVGFGGFEKIDQRDRVRVHRRGPPLLQQHGGRPTTRASISSPATRSCAGAEALSFVRFRHTDSDIVRNARQQDFIRWAKAQFGRDQILNERGTLLRIFGKNATTDHNLHTTDGLINLFDLVAFSAVRTIKQIPSPP